MVCVHQKSGSLRLVHQESDSSKSDHQKSGSSKLVVFRIQSDVHLTTDNFVTGRGGSMMLRLPS
jgi:hypothetical protein